MPVSQKRNPAAAAKLDGGGAAGAGPGHHPALRFLRGVPAFLRFDPHGADDDWPRSQSQHLFLAGRPAGGTHPDLDRPSSPCWPARFSLSSWFGSRRLASPFSVPTWTRADRENSYNLFITVCLIATATFTGGLWTTLLLRQLAGAFWLTLLVPATLSGFSGIFLAGSESDQPGDRGFERGDWGLLGGGISLRALAVFPRAGRGLVGRSHCAAGMEMVVCARGRRVKLCGNGSPFSRC